MTPFFNSNRKKAKGLILMYHQVHELPVDTWQLAVSRANFEAHLKVLSRFPILMVKDMVAALTEGRLQNETISISFDDGYRSNFTYAFPLLETYNLPASYYLTNLTRESEHFYWWDELEHLLLGRTHELPDTLLVVMNDFYKSLKLKDSEWREIIDEEFLRAVSGWLPWATPPSQAHAVFLWLCEYFKTLGSGNQEELLYQLKNQLNANSNWSDSYQLMSEEEMQQLASHGLSEIGAHTRGHLALSNFAGAIQKEEMLSNKTSLGEKFNKKITGLAYPHGAYSEETINIAKESGFVYGLTTVEGIIHSGSELFQLPRIHVKDWSGNQFEKEVLKWFKQLA